jgi:hypothetical protein
MPALFTSLELENMAKTFNLPSYKPPLKAALDKLVIDYELSSNVNTILQSYIVVKK